jgi:hypothetical protein
MPVAPNQLGDLFPGGTTVGDFTQLSTMTFAASSGYSLVGSDVAVCIFLGRVSEPTFRIDYETADDQIDWDTGTGELDVTIEAADWSTFAPSNPVTLLVSVQILIPDASPVTFWGSLQARPAVVAAGP